MKWQVKCNDGWDHRFGESDDPLEARCEVCRMSVVEVQKRKLCNRVINLTGKDPYTEHGRDILVKKLGRALGRIRVIESLKAT